MSYYQDDAQHILVSWICLGIKTKSNASLRDTDKFLAIKAIIHSRLCKARSWKMSFREYFGNKPYLGVGFKARKWSNERLRGILGTERSQSNNQQTHNISKQFHIREISVPLFGNITGIIITNESIRKLKRFVSFRNEQIDQLKVVKITNTRICTNTRVWLHKNWYEICSVTENTVYIVYCIRK